MKKYRSVDTNLRVEGTYSEYVGMGMLKFDRLPQVSVTRSVEVKNKDGSTALVLDFSDEELIGIEFFSINSMPKALVGILYSAAANVEDDAPEEDPPWWEQVPQIIELSLEGAEKLAAMIANPPEPTEELKKLMKRSDALKTMAQMSQRYEDHDPGDEE